MTNRIAYLNPAREAVLCSWIFDLGNQLTSWAVLTRVHSALFTSNSFADSSLALAKYVFWDLVLERRR